MSDLKELREKIDAIDREIVSAFEKRMELSEEVALVKIDAGRPVLDPAREEEKLRSVAECTTNVFTRRGAVELFSQIMSISRKRQYQMLSERGLSEEIPFSQVDRLPVEGIRSVFQGERGAYAEAALYAFFGKDANNYHVATWRDAMEEITAGRAEYAVLPFENSSAGIVSENYDLMAEYDVAIVGEQIIPIEHCLLGTREIPLDEIKQVYSHPQALMQCSAFLEEHRGMERISLKNTALAAKKVSEDGRSDEAAIASALTADLYGLKILKRGIQDVSNNSTRFIIVSRKKIYVKGSGKISIAFEIPHESGSLYRVLSHFIFNGINMNRIESRPIKGRKWEYRFFIDIDGNLQDSAVQNALKGLNEETNHLKILGNY